MYGHKPATITRRQIQQIRWRYRIPFVFLGLLIMRLRPLGTYQSGDLLASFASMDVDPKNWAPDSLDMIGVYWENLMSEEMKFWVGL